ncbi:hypothetical protein ACIGW7_37855 [Streptomyces sp. NPDC053253]|uniref:hypothetical protein n=1 Tax=Streptomyces sp. NPDC053253 TaxID=3365699 RepID=UPI0037D4F004
MLWYRHVDWVRHTAVLAAAVAAAGLAITGWGTVKAAQVANDQLAQSRERKDQEQRRVVSKVTSWSEDGATVFANRSLDPSRTFVTVYVVTAADPGSVWLLLVGTMPPCSRVTIPDSVMKTAATGEKDPYVDFHVHSLVMSEPSATGALWERNDEGGLRAIQHDQWTRYKDRIPHHLKKLENPALLAAEGAVQAPLQDCSTFS